MQPEGQLEFFDVSGASAPTPQRHALGRVALQLRYEHAILAGIAALMGVAVIFASGVERGKQLVRAERATVAHEEPRTHLVAPAVVPTVESERADDAASSVPATPAPKKTQGPVERRRPAPTTPRKLASKAGSRYVIQIVTYRQPTRAQRTLQQLQANGEKAFLVLREGHMSVCVGPFTSRDHATQKLARLKTQYQDCFIKSL